MLPLPEYGPERVFVADFLRLSAFYLLLPVDLPAAGVVSLDPPVVAPCFPLSLLGPGLA